MKLQNKILKRVDKSGTIIARLCVEMKRSYPTVRRWIKSNDEMLTTATALNIICSELNVEQSEVLTE